MELAWEILGSIPEAGGPAIREQCHWLDVERFLSVEFLSQGMERRSQLEQRSDGDCCGIRLRATTSGKGHNARVRENVRKCCCRVWNMLEYMYLCIVHLVVGIVKC